jgi:hypothetical protein
MFYFHIELSKMLSIYNSLSLYLTFLFYSGFFLSCAFTMTHFVIYIQVTLIKNATIQSTQYVKLVL